MNLKSNHSHSVAVLIIVAIVAADLFLWQQIFSLRHADVPHEYFLNVGQGDSELIIFPGNVKVIVDAGPDNKVLASLGNILPTGDDYIDLAIVSYPEFADFNGFNFLLDHYRVGAFIYNGRDATASGKEWAALKNKIKERKIPLVTLGRGDKIRIGRNVRLGGSEISVLSPNPAFAQSVDPIEAGLVVFVKTPEFATLLTADIDFNVENWLIVNSRSVRDIHTDVLKVSHHGSKYASGDRFLRAVNPEIAVIEFGAKNAFSRPSKEALARLANGTFARVLRTDKTGTVEIYPERGKLKIIKEK